MKYCAKCGTPMSDDTVVCPQCHTEANNNHSQISKLRPPSSVKNASSKKNLLNIINVILSTVILITMVTMYFISPTSNNSTNNNAFNSTCPASEYGYHDWSAASCTKPSHCYECGAYRDDKLGEHDFYTDDDGLCSCWDCGILYETYINSLD